MQTKIYSNKVYNILGVFAIIIQSYDFVRFFYLIYILNNSQNLIDGKVSIFALIILPLTSILCMTIFIFMYFYKKIALDVAISWMFISILAGFLGRISFGGVPYYINSEKYSIYKNYCFVCEIGFLLYYMFLTFCKLKYNNRKLLRRN